MICPPSVRIGTSRAEGALPLYAACWPAAAFLPLPLCFLPDAAAAVPEAADAAVELVSVLLAPATPVELVSVLLVPASTPVALVSVVLLLEAVEALPVTRVRSFEKSGVPRPVT